MQAFLGQVWAREAISCGTPVWVADRGLTSAENRRYLRRGDDHYIMGEKLRSASKEAQAALSRAGRYKEVAGNLKVKEVQISDEERFLVCHNPEAAERDASVRARLVDHLTELIKDSGLWVEAAAERRTWGSPDTHSLITIFSHFGSHIDAPSHHIDGGAGICDLGPDFYTHDRPLLVDIPKGEVEMVEARDLAPFASEMKTCDGLFIRTGWSSKRSQQPVLYTERGPAISSGAPEYIMKGCPKLRGDGMDSLSIGSPVWLDDAIVAHEVLAGKRGHGRGVIVIEDIHLNLEADRLVRVFTLPLFMRGLEGSSCTVVAQLGSKEQQG